MNQQSHRDTEEEPVIQTVAEPLHQYLKKNALPTSPAKPSSKAGSPRPYRPTNRQPLAALTVLDDGSRESGELIRLRVPKFVIGREKGDLTLPFDGDASGHHAELRCQKQKGRFRWYLIDRDSTNGTFVRAVRASLSRESELIIGGRRYCFQLPDAGSELAETAALQTHAYRAPGQTMLEQFVPRLIEAGTEEDSPNAFAIAAESIMGSDAKCHITIENDPLLNPTHARFYQNETERWMVEDQKSLNGTWIRVKRFPMDRRTEFQVGQQRFVFQPNFS